MIRLADGHGRDAVLLSASAYLDVMKAMSDDVLDMAITAGAERLHLVVDPPTKKHLRSTLRAIVTRRIPS